MSIGELMRIVARRWWLAVLPAAVMAVLTAATWTTPGTIWQVKMGLQVGLAPEPARDAYSFDGHYNWLASEYLTRGIADLVNTGAFAENVARRLEARGVAATPAQIQAAISRDYRGTLVNLYVTWPDAAQSAQVAEAVTSELGENASRYFPQLRDVKVAPFQRLDAPIPAPIATGLRSRFDLPVRALLALAAGLGLALLAHALDPYVRDRRQMERMGLTVVGNIPA